MVQPTSSKLQPTMTSRDRDGQGPSRSQGRPCRTRRDSPRRECPPRASRALVRSPEGVCRDTRSRSSGPFYSSRRCRRRRVSASPVRSTTPRATHRHRALEESSSTSSTYPMLQHRCRGEHEDVSRENRRRMLERRDMLEDEDEEEFMKKSFGDRICKAAKMTSGILISLGLVLVFYVIITTILGESSPLDIFNFEFGADDFLRHQENLTEPTFIMDLERRETDFGILLESGSQELEFQGSETHKPDGLPIGESSILQEERGTEETMQKDMDLVHRNQTDAEGRSYIAYIPVPLNNEEEEEEEEEEETRSSEHSNPLFVPVMIVPGESGSNNFPHADRRPHHVLPPVRPPLPHVPVQRPPLLQRRITPLVPGGVPRSLPTRPLLPHPQITRLPPQKVPPVGGSFNLPVIPNPTGGLQKVPPVGGPFNLPVIPNPTGGLQKVPPVGGPFNLPVIPNPTGGLQQPSRTPNSSPEANARVMSGAHQPFTANLDHSGGGGGQPSHVGQLMGGGLSGLNGNLQNNGNFGSGGNNMNRMSSANVNDNGQRVNSMNGMNMNRGMNLMNEANTGMNNMNNGMNSMNRMNSGINSMTGIKYGMNSMNEMNNVQGINSGVSGLATSGFSTRSSASAGQDIWNSLFEIMNHPSGGSSGSSRTVNGGSVIGTMGQSQGQLMDNVGESRGHVMSSLGNGPSKTGMERMTLRPPFLMPPGIRSLHQPSPSVPRDGLPTPQRIGGLRPNSRPPERQMRPRLLPRSRMSGPLPKPLPHRRPLPRYRYNLPPIPPPMGMPIAPRRPRRPQRHQPPKDFQYPHDSTSIQDIIRYMKEKEQQGSRVRPPPGFIVGSQDHIVGPNPFSNSNSEGNMNFGNAPQNDFNNGGGNNFNSGGSYGFRGNNYNDGNNFHNGGNNFAGGFGDGNNPVGSGIGGINGYSNGGSNNFNGGYHHGNNFNSGGSNFNHGDNSFNSGGSFNSFSGGNSFNSGGNNFNNQGHNIHSDGVNGGISLPPVKNTYDPSVGKSRPFSIMLDVYPMEDSAAVDSRPFQSSISLATNSGQFDPNSRYNSNNNGYKSGGRFSPEDEANKHEVVLHLNLYSKSPTVNRRQGSSGELAVGRSGAVSLEIPLTGALSPLDIYKAVMSKARSQKPQAQVQVIPGKEEENTHSHDEAEIELFDVEEGPQLLEAIEQGLRELNTHLPPHQQFVFTGEPMSVIDLHNAVNDEGNSSAPSQESTGRRRPPASPPYDYNYDYEYYDYYDYYDYEDVGYGEVEPEQTVTVSPTTTMTPVEDGLHEQLPTPCWYKTDEDFTGSAD